LKNSEPSGYLTRPSGGRGNKDCIIRMLNWVAPKLRSTRPKLLSNDGEVVSSLAERLLGSCCRLNDIPAPGTEEVAGTCTDL